MEITIITSAYNAEKTIEDTIRSVLNQSFSSFEYIIINHGSNDGTAAILHSYELIDRRIKVITLNENKGRIGRAINIGIQQAIGKYVTFLDADDLYHAEYLSVMYNNIEKDNYDLVVCGSSRIDEKEIEFLVDTIKEDQIFDKKEDYQLLPNLINEVPTRYFTVWWNKLYRMSYLKQNRIYLSEETLVHGDARFNLEILLMKPRMYCSSYIGTKWRQTIGSVSFGTYKAEYRREIMDVCKQYFDLYEKCSASNEENKALAKKLITTVATKKRLRNYHVSNEEMVKEINLWKEERIYQKMEILSKFSEM